MELSGLTLHPVWAERLGDHGAVRICSDAFMPGRRLIRGWGGEGDSEAEPGHQWSLITLSCPREMACPRCCGGVGSGGFRPQRQRNSCVVKDLFFLKRFSRL